MGNGSSDISFRTATKDTEIIIKSAAITALPLSLVAFFVVLKRNGGVRGVHCREARKAQRCFSEATTNAVGMFCVYIKNKKTALAAVFYVSQLTLSLSFQCRTYA